LAAIACGAYIFYLKRNASFGKFEDEEEPKKDDKSSKLNVGSNSGDHQR